MKKQRSKLDPLTQRSRTLYSWNKHTFIQLRLEHHSIPNTKNCFVIISIKVAAYPCIIMNL